MVTRFVVTEENIDTFLDFYKEHWIGGDHDDGMYILKLQLNDGSYDFYIASIMIINEQTEDQYEVYNFISLRNGNCLTDSYSDEEDLLEGMMNYSQDGELYYLESLDELSGLLMEKNITNEGNKQDC